MSWRTLTNWHVTQSTAETTAKDFRKRHPSDKFRVRKGRRNWEVQMMETEIPKTKRFDGKVYELLSGRPKTKADADFSVVSWRSRGRNRGARAVKVDGGYVIYVRGG